MVAVDGHVYHESPLADNDLQPYSHARVPVSQQEARERAGVGSDRLGGEGAAHPARSASAGRSRRPPPSKKAVAPQIAAFNAGKARVPRCETADLLQRWQDLVQRTDPAGRDAPLRQIGT